MITIPVTGPADKEGVVETHWFGATVPELESLKNWRQAAEVTTVAMESTASYWIPVKNVLETAFHILLVCPKKHHPKKGEKTDFLDAVFLARQHRHGMLTGSYLPEKGVVELRDLTRRHKKLPGNLGAGKNRIQKTLEVANVKIGNVIGDVFGVSGQQMLDLLLSGRPAEPGEIAELAKTRLRTKIPQLTEALEGHHLNDHHRWLIRQSVEHIILLDRQMEAIEETGYDGVSHGGPSVQLGRNLPGQQPRDGPEPERKDEARPTNSCGRRWCRRRGARRGRKEASSRRSSPGGRRRWERKRRLWRWLTIF